MNYYGLDWLGTVVGLTSIYYLGQRRRVGFVLRIIASLFWVAFAVVAGTVAGVIANLAVILLSLNGMKEWKRAEKDPRPVRGIASSGLPGPITGFLGR